MNNRKLSRHMQDASFYEIRRQIEYKCLFYGKTLVVADRFFAYSKTCHKCGWHNDGLTLRDREWECQVCLTRLDRDLNAALNLESFGLRALAGDAGLVLPLKKSSVDDRAAMRLKSMISENEEK